MYFLEVIFWDLFIILINANEFVYAYNTEKALFLRYFLNFPIYTNTHLAIPINHIPQTQLIHSERERERNSRSAQREKLRSVLERETGRPEILSLKNTKMAGSMKSCMVMLMMMMVASMQMQSSIAQTRHVVGDALGWTIPPNGAAAYTTWASQQNFTVGDSLGTYIYNSNRRPPPLPRPHTLLETVFYQFYSLIKNWNILLFKYDYE